MTTQRIALASAERIATNLMRGMAPACLRIEIGGSIRRNRALVKDVELVLIPKWEERTVDGAQVALGDEPPRERVNLLAELIERKVAEGRIRVIKPGTKEIEDWPLKPAGRYWRCLLPSGIKVDIFIVTPANWGTGLLIRTGPAFGPSQTPRDGFTPAMLRRWEQVSHGGKMQGMMLHTPDGKEVATPEEATVFSLVQVRYVPPEARFAAADVESNAIGVPMRKSR